uniref:Uncharacterized protein n=1 Tax=Anguilla anguilla TaxID=7936 RepID=A0A0E9VF81_ANGAN
MHSLSARSLLIWIHVLRFTERRRGKVAWGGRVLFRSVTCKTR